MSSKQPPSIAENAAPLIPVPIHGKDEMNLAEFPIARLGRSDTRLTIEYQGQIVDKTGGVLEQKWIVSGSAKFGLPTEFAERVLVGLIILTARENFVDRKVPFTIYRVLKLLGMSHNKRNYEAVEKALQQLTAVTIYSEGAFWDKEQQKRITSKKGFHLLEEYWLRSQETDEGVIEEEESNAYVIWSDRMWRSFKAGYIKNIDAGFYYSLTKTLTRRLYRFLDKRMHYQDTYQIDVFDLAARLGMKPYRYPSDVTTKLKPAVEELQKRGYLERMEVLKMGKFTRMKFFRCGASYALQPRLLDADEDDQDAPEKTERGFGSDEGAYAALASLYERYGTSDTLKQVWAGVLSKLEGVLLYDTWCRLDDSALLEAGEGLAVIAVNANSYDWIQKQMQRHLLSELRGLLKEPITRLEFVQLSD